MATVTINQSPFLYDTTPNYMWFVASSTASSTTDFEYIFDMYEVDQSTSLTMSYLGRYAVPSSPNGDGLFTPNRVINSLLYPDMNYDTTSFIQATNSIAQYSTKYGFQYNPGLTFSDMSNNGGFVSFLTLQGVIEVNDIITIDKYTKSINGSYDGQTSVTTVTPTFGLDVVTTTIPFGVTASNEGGLITLLTRIVGTFSDLYGFPGTRQYLQRTFDFGSPYNYLMGSTSSKFLSTYDTYQGREYPVFATQSQSISFLAQSASYSLPSYLVNTYDSNYSPINSYSFLTGITPNYRRWDGPAGPANLSTLGVTFSGVKYYNVGFSIPGSNQDVVVNGDFATTSGWTFSISPGNNALGIVSGQGLGFLGNSFSVATASQPGIYTIGHNYIYNIEIDINTGTDVYILDGSLSLLTTAGTGSFTGTFSAGSTGLSLIFNPGTHTPPADIHTANISSISVVDTSIIPTGKNFRWYEIEDNCCLYENFQIAFLNSIGAFDYWNFNKQSQKKYSVKREEYRSDLSYNYSIGDRGYDILSVKVDEVLSINTDWITDYESEFLKQILFSQQVYHIDNNGNLLPIIITDSDYIVKKVLRDQLFQLNLNFKYANAVNTFSL